MKNYYLLRKESDPTIIGNMGDSSQSEIKRELFGNVADYDYLIETLGSNNYWNVKDSLNWDNVKIDAVSVSKLARLTEILQFSPHLINCPFLISKKLKDIFESKNCSDINFIETKANWRGKNYQYYLIHIAPLGVEAIDIKESIYSTGNHIKGKNIHRFNSLKEKLIFEDENFDFEVCSVAIKGNQLKNKDIFSVPDIGLVISEEVKDRLFELNVEGGIILPAFGGETNWPKVRIV